MLLCAQHVLPVSSAPIENGAWMKEISDLRRRLSAEESYESAYLGALESLASGITTVGDISTTGSAAKAADKVGLRAVVYREISAIDKNLVNYSLKKGVSDLEKWSSKLESDRVSFGLAPVPSTHL